jgi:hypothetical protein
MTKDYPAGVRTIQLPYGAFFFSLVQREVAESFGMVEPVFNPKLFRMVKHSLFTRLGVLSYGLPGDQKVVGHFLLGRRHGRRIREL